MESNILIEIPGCMKQYLVLFTPNCNVTCVSSLKFQLDECFKEQGAADVDFPEDLEGFENDECDEDIDQNQQIFDSLSMYLHLCLFLQTIQQNRFISLRLLKSQLQSKTWRIHAVTLFIPINCSSKGITWNSWKSITKFKQQKILNLSNMWTYMTLT